MRGPGGEQPSTPEEIVELGDQYWPLRAYRELDDALLHLRMNEPEIGLVCVRTEGSAEDVLSSTRRWSRTATTGSCARSSCTWRRVLRRLDLTAKSFFALAEPGGCFAGNLLELLLAADRVYMLNDPEQPVELAAGEMNAGALPMSNGLTRLQSRFLAEPERADAVLAHEGAFDADEAEEFGLVTFAPDDLDWEDEVRVAIEERTSLSPDALTGMEASLRFAGPETHGHENLRAADGLAELDFPAPQRRRPAGRADQLRQAHAAAVRLQADVIKP